MLAGAGNGFCSGGSVHGIIAKLLDMTAEEQLRFTMLTCAVVKNMRALKKPIIAAVNGIAAGAGTILALASDICLLPIVPNSHFSLSESGSWEQTWGPVIC